MELYQIFAVINRESLKRLQNIFQSADTKVSLSQPARGTAPGEILNRLGLAETEKLIVSTIADAQQKRTIFRQARDKMYMDIPGNGILAAIPLKSIAGRQTLAFLTDQELKEGAPSMDFEYELIVVVLNEGYADMVMDAARGAGAGGGTLLHAKGTGGKRGEKFFSVSLADEKDMIYIVSHREEKTAVMKAIQTQAGPGTKAGGICFSLPISSVMGLRSREPASDE